MNMQDVKRIIIVSHCHYLYAGLKALLSSVSLPLILEQVITADEAGKKVSLGRGDMVMIAQESGCPADRTRSRAVVWRLEYLMRTGTIPWVPCALLTQNMQIELGKKTFSLTQSWLHEELEILLSGVLSTPECYYPEVSVSQYLTAQQSVLLKELLAGQDVKGIAAALHLSPRAVFAGRGALIRKLGLRNRLELMCLNRQGFSGAEWN